MFEVSNCVLFEHVRFVDALCAEPSEAQLMTEHGAASLTFC